MIKTKGFSLTEILIVVVILGVLAAMVIPRFMRQDERGVVAEAVVMLSAIRQGEQAYSVENSDAYTETLADLDIEIPASERFDYKVEGADDPDTATATATRLPAGGCTESDYGSCTIIINIKNGTWSAESTHPFAPK